MRAVALAALVALCACDARQRTAAAQQPSGCTPVMSDGQVAMFKRLQDDAASRDKPNFTTDETFAVDCVIMTARQYATMSDASSVVAKAVQTACKPQIDAVGTDVYEHRTENANPADAAEVLDIAGREQDRIEGELNELPLKYVIEARSLHCLAVRPATDAELPSSDYNIE